MRGDNIPWDCGEHPSLGKGHNDMSHTLQKHYVQPRSPHSKSPPTQLDSAAVIYDLNACVATSSGATAHAWVNTAAVYMLIVCMGIL